MHTLLILVLALLSFPAVAMDTLYDWRLIDSDSPKKTLAVSELAEQLLNTDVVFVGEYHGHPAVHLFQLRLLQALWQQNPALILSLEQFSRDKQSILDAYLAGDLGEKAFIAQSNAWSNYSDYRPLIEFARERGIPVVASNAPRAIVRCVGQLGAAYLDTLPAREREWVARKLHLQASGYRERFFRYFNYDYDPTVHSAQGDEPQQLEQFEQLEKLKRRYAAQVTWDDTMAESIADVRRDKPRHQVVHLAGAFHLESGQGTVERLMWRSPQITTRVISPLQLGEPAPVEKQELGRGDYILRVNPMPKAYNSPEEMQAQMRRHHHARRASSDVALSRCQ